MSDVRLQAMLNYLTSLPQDKIQEVRIRFEAVNVEHPEVLSPNLAVIFKD